MWAARRVQDEEEEKEEEGTKLRFALLRFTAGRMVGRSNRQTDRPTAREGRNGAHDGTANLN